MNNKDKQKIIESFIHAYNTFDLDGMLKNIHRDILFENISKGQVDLKTEGIDEFKKQAEYAMIYFEKRREKITNINFEGDRVELDIDYLGILAKDLSNELKSGDTLKLKGKSIFRFQDNKIRGIRDIIE